MGFRHSYSEHHVYGLVDPRTGVIFYIGVTCIPNGRMLNHRYDPGSSAWERTRAIEALGLKVRMDILATYLTRREALDHEATLIERLPGLLNIAGRKGYRSLVKRYPPIFGERGDLIYVPIEEMGIA